jgi:hypothetical protein
MVGGECGRCDWGRPRIAAPNRQHRLPRVIRALASHSSRAPCEQSEAPGVNRAPLLRFLSHREAGIPPRADSSVQHLDVGPALVPILGRPTDGCGVVESTAVEDQFSGGGQ